MKHAQIMTEANTDADHDQVVVKICIRLKKIISSKQKPRWNLYMLYAK